MVKLEILDYGTDQQAYAGPKCPIKYASVMAPISTSI